MIHSLNFRMLLVGLLAVHLFCACDPVNSQGSEYFMYVASGDDQDHLGIGVYRWSPQSGSISLVYNDSNLAMSSYLEIDAKKSVLYSVGEGGVSAHRIDPSTGELTFINRVDHQGRDACHVSIAENSEFLFVGYYSSGSMAVFDIEGDGSVGTLVDSRTHEGSSVHPDRQEAPHIHMVLPVPNSELILVPDLGIDQVKGYRVGTGGKLQEVRRENNAEIEAGGGPRHAVIHPSGRSVYVLHELTGEVSGFTFDPALGFMNNIGTWSTLKEGFNGFNKSADIHISKDGAFLYASNRGPNDIAVFRIDQETGELTRRANLDCGGDWPRAFAIDPSGRYLMVANKRSNALSMMSIDPQTGLFEKQLEVPTPLAPQAIRFIQVR